MYIKRVEATKIYTVIVRLISTIPQIIVHKNRWMGNNPLKNAQEKTRK